MFLKRLFLSQSYSWKGSDLRQVSSWKGRIQIMASPEKEITRYKFVPERTSFEEKNGRNQLSWEKCNWEEDMSSECRAHSEYESCRRWIDSNSSPKNNRAVRNVALLYAMTIAHTVAIEVKAKCKSPEEVYVAAEGAESLKEVLTQIQVYDGHPEFSKILQFTRDCLWCLRAVLQKCHIDVTIIYGGAPPRMPGLEDSVWSVQHPNRSRFLTEVKSGLAYLVELGDRHGPLAISRN